jgi:hypothetical protein
MIAFTFMSLLMQLTPASSPLNITDAMPQNSTEAMLHITGILFAVRFLLNGIGE